MSVHISSLVIIADEAWMSLGKAGLYHKGTESNFLWKYIPLEMQFVSFNLFL